LLSKPTAPAAFIAKPVPVIVITVPGTPEVGLKATLGEGTVKLAEASTGTPEGMSALTGYVPGATAGTVKMIPEGIAPAAVVVTDTRNSPGSIAPSPLLSKPTAPAIFGAKPLPVIVITVPGTPEVGLKATLSEGTVKLAEASTDPPEGMSALTGYVLGATAGTVKMIPAGIAPAAVVVTDT
jgi:hypothetical protein